MEFEVINDKNRTVMNTMSKSCLPDKKLLISMSKNGYKFRLNGKMVTVKKLNDKLKEQYNIDLIKS